jgi:hypothetical protein
VVDPQAPRPFLGVVICKVNKGEIGKRESRFPYAVEIDPAHIISAIVGKGKAGKVTEIDLREAHGTAECRVVVREKAIREFDEQAVVDEDRAAHPRVAFFEDALINIESPLDSSEALVIMD